MTQISKLAQRYAKSLFDLAQPAESLDAVQAKLRLLSDSLGEHPALIKGLEASFYTAPEQYRLVELMMRTLCRGGSFDASASLLNNFLKLLVKKGRLYCLVDIAKAFEALMLEHKGVAEVELCAASEPTEAQKSELLDLLKNILKKDILLKTNIDKSLLGGFIVKFGSYQIDTSILTKLSSLKLALKEGS